MSRENALAVQVVAAFSAMRGWSMTARCALEMVLEMVAAPSREQLRKRETGQTKRLGKRGAFRRQLSHKKAQNAPRFPYDARSHKVLRNEISACRSSADKARPNRCPLIARTLTPAPLNPVGT